jgi:hypothetical protein
MVQQGTYCCDESGAGVPTQTVLEYARHFAVTVRDVRALLSLRQCRDDLAQTGQTQVDCL